MGADSLPLNKLLEKTSLTDRVKEHDAVDRLIIGLDFGTTFSGIAYSFAKGTNPEPISILDWPGGEGAKLLKIPTIICYDGNNKKVFTWGEMKHKTGTVAGVKLLLDPDQPRPLYLPESTAKTDLRQLGKPAVDVVADFIGAMYKHAMTQIEAQSDRDYLAMCQKQFVLTVPAVWSDKAKDTTMRAAKLAGLHPITLIKEPEAAALYTLHVLQDGVLAIGDAIVICDAGGGTVDLISYEITSLKPLELKELVPGKGGMAGSLGLNRRFEQAVKELVGEDQYFFLRKTRAFSDAVIQFDRSIKTAFRGDPDEDYLVNFPMAKLVDDPDRNLVSNCWNLSGSDVKTIFDPLINDIERMVDEQVNLVKVKRLSEGHPKADEIKALFLVGGFGSSKYLKKRLEVVHPDIQIIQPHDAWAAIVRGAVLSKLPQTAEVVSTQAVRHYGVEARSIWEAERDKGRPKIWDATIGQNRVDKMTWFIYMGEDLTREQTIRFPFFRSLTEGYSDSRLIFEDQLIQSENKIPPVHPAPGSTKTNCTLTADLRGVDRSQFIRKVGTDSVAYYDIYYDLVVTICPGAVMKFSLEMNGKEMGTVNAKYD